MSVALFPIGRNIDALWARYACIARAVADDPKLLVDRDMMEAYALAHEEWRRAFLESTEQ